MLTKITTQVDVNLKACFEATRNKHKLTYRDILENGIREIIKDIDPKKLIELDIQEVEFQQEERRQALSMIKIAPKQKLLTDDQDDRLEKLREEMFAKDQESIMRLWGKRTGPNWENIVVRYQFKNKQEARNWIISHLEVCKIT